MTQLSDLEISKALALAIGWKPEQMRVNADEILMLQATDANFARPFDYRTWSVIGPIATKHDAFPMHGEAGWYSSNLAHALEYADTPQKAIALAVIAGTKP